MALGGLQHPGRDVRQGDPEDQRREDSRNGLPPMPGNGDPVGGGVRATDYWRGTILPGATEGTIPVQGVRRGYVGGIFGGAQDGTAWASGRVETDL